MGPYYVTNPDQGSELEFTAPAGGVIGGTPKLIGTILVIPVHDAAVGSKFRGVVSGQFSLPKNTGAGTGWVEGAKVFWDAGIGKVTGVATGNQLVGWGATAAADGDTIGRVRLDGVAR
ncbi:MAG TPA: DUF2190 family protein [bacterium]|nr:DUF2190 family protein [bacterium]